MAKNYFDRYVWLINLIGRHGHISFADISRAWASSSLNVGDSVSRKESHLPQRTFFNHIAAIFDVFGIEIKCDRSLGYYIANGDPESDSVRRWLLESLSLNNMLSESRDMKDRILFEKIASSQRWLSVLVNAMRDGKAVEMTYQSFQRDEPHTFLLHPYCLKLFKQRWYVLGKSEEYKTPRIYALDERMVEVVESDKALKLPSKFDASSFFSHYFGIVVTEAKPEKVLLRVDVGQTRYLDTLPLHASQKVVGSDERGTCYEFFLVPTYDFKQELLRFGPFVEVVEPQWFREEIASDIERMAMRYGLNAAIVDEGADKKENVQ